MQYPFFYRPMFEIMEDGWTAFQAEFEFARVSNVSGEWRLSSVNKTFQVNYTILVKWFVNNILWRSSHFQDFGSHMTPKWLLYLTLVSLPLCLLQHVRLEALFLVAIAHFSWDPQDRCLVDQRPFLPGCYCKPHHKDIWFYQTETIGKHIVYFLLSQ